MKTITFIFLLMPFWTLNSLAQNTDVTGLLDKPETKTEIFNTILNDHQLMLEFMTALKENDHAMMMMKENHSMMDPEEHGSSAMGEGHHMMEMKDENQMMDHDAMMGMMKDNPEMMQNMMGNMMDMSEQDSTMRCKMSDMMIQHPQMMQMCMQKMKEQGMMGTDGKMMMNSKVQSEKEEHNH